MNKQCKAAPKGTGPGPIPEKAASPGRIHSMATFASYLIGYCRRSSGLSARNLNLIQASIRESFPPQDQTQLHLANGFRQALLHRRPRQALLASTSPPGAPDIRRTQLVMSAQRITYNRLIRRSVYSVNQTAYRWLRSH